MQTSRWNWKGVEVILVWILITWPIESRGIGDSETEGDLQGVVHAKGLRIQDWELLKKAFWSEVAEGQAMLVWDQMSETAARGTVVTTHGRLGLQPCEPERKWGKGKSGWAKPEWWGQEGLAETIGG